MSCFASGLHAAPKSVGVNDAMIVRELNDIHLTRGTYTINYTQLWIISIRVCTIFHLWLITPNERFVINTE